MVTQIGKQWGGLIICLVCLTRTTFAQSLERFTFTEPHLGTIITLTLYASEENAANEAARSAFLRVKELDLIFSDYKPDSEVMRLCQHAGSGQPVPASPELFQLLQRALTISDQTQGAFDVTVGPLVQLWRRARKQKTLPTPDEIATARELVGWKRIVLNSAKQTVELTKPGMRLDFGGIAKGFIAQQVSQQLREQGFQQTLVAVAGDLVAGDAPPQKAGWRIGVAPLETPNGPPSRMLQLKNCAISTSGDAFQFVEIAGVRYSHIVDPQTGLGLTQQSSCTIIAREGATADALATAVCVLGSARGLKLIESCERTAGLMVTATDDKPQTVKSKSFSEYELP